MIYFLNDEHEANYLDLMAMYRLENFQDVQYQASIYIASIPDIYRLLNIEELKLERKSPLITLTRYDQNKDMLIPAHEGLTGSTTQLVKIGLSLYNGYPCDLDYMFSNEFTNIVIQAIKIRNKVVS